MITQMLDVDNPQVCHSVMIGAKRNQIIEIILASIGNRCDVVNVDMKVKSTYGTFVIVPHHDLLFKEFPPATLPTTIQVGYLWIAFCEAVAVAVIALLNLTWKSIQRSTASVTTHGHAVYTPRLCRHALPLYVALALAARHLCLGRVCIKCLSTNGAGAPFFASAIIAVIGPSVLMGIDIPVLQRRIPLTGNLFAAPARTVDRTGIIDASCHGSIIHA